MKKIALASLLLSFAAMADSGPLFDPSAVWLNDAGGNPLTSDNTGALFINFGTGALVPNANAAGHPILAPLNSWLFDGSGNPLSSTAGALNVNCVAGCGGGGGGVSSVALALPSFMFSISGSPVTTSGTLTGSLKTIGANLFLAGPTALPSATPTYRAIVGADLPNPTPSTLGGIESIASVTHNFLTSVSTSGVPSASQPSCSDLSNGAASCSTDTTNASNITAGTLPAAQLPNPSSTTLGGVQSIASAAHNFLTAISTSGVPSKAQPAFSDISGTATPAQVGATPTPTASTIAMFDANSNLNVSSGLTQTGTGAFTFSGNFTDTGGQFGFTLNQANTISTGGLLKILNAGSTKFSVDANGGTLMNGNSEVVGTFKADSSSTFTGGANFGTSGLSTTANNATLKVGISRTFSSANQTQVDIAHQTDSSSSGSGTAVSITPTYNQTSTAGGIDLLINRTETAVGSGAQKFLSMQVASSEKGFIDHLGNLSLSGTTLTMANIAAVTPGTAACWSGSGVLGTDAANCIASLREYKQDVVPITGEAALDVVNRLGEAAVYYRYTDDFLGAAKDNPHARDVQPGFIAEEVEAIDPRYASYNGAKLRGVKYEQLAATEAAAIRELSRQVEELRAELKKCSQ